MVSMINTISGVGEYDPMIAEYPIKRFMIEFH